ncbi:MAG: ribosome silencing factor [Clostridiales bacterium]|nr:ribosome silencing factor [Clostridiales bacterium]
MEKTILNTISQIVKNIDDKLGKDICVLDLTKLNAICDYFIITSASSTRQVKSIVDGLEDKEKEHDMQMHHKEGYTLGRWVLLDYGHIVVHVFLEEERQFYGLENNWKDALVVDITQFAQY